MQKATGVRDWLEKDLEEIEARARAIKSKIEKDKVRYKKLILRNLALT